MDRRKNPYAPGAGLQPPELAGRDKLLEDAMIDMDRVLDGRPTKGMMMLGLRGVGKTVLLNRLHRMAEEKGFRTRRATSADLHGKINWAVQYHSTAKGEHDSHAQTRPAVCNAVC
jgi:hypothetical protein